MLGLSVVKAVWDSSAGLEVVDLRYLAAAGADLFGPDWLDTYSDPGIQVGPVTLLVLGLLWRVAAETGADLQLLFSLVVQPGVVLSCLWLVGRGTAGAHRRLAQGLVAVLLIFWEIPWNAYLFGHPSEFLIPMLWIWGALLAREGRGGRAGAVVALSAGLKAWGVLGIPLLLLAAPGRDRLRGIVVALAAVTLFYGPFFLFGEVGTFRYRWPVDEATGAALVLPPGARFGWLPRLVQGALALGVGSLVVAIARKRSEVFIWTPALAIIAVRLATDPLAFNYYWLAAQGVLLVASGWLIAARAPVGALFLVALAALTFMTSTVPVVAISLLLLAVAITAALLGDRLELLWMPLRPEATKVDSLERPLTPGP